MSDRPFGMTSREAAALYLSNGRTDDPDLAGMYDAAEKQPELLIPKGTIPMKDYRPPALVIDDPEEAERIRLRNAIGFDVEVTINTQAMRALLKDTEAKLFTRCKLTGDQEIDSAAMAKAMIRLKAKHDKQINTKARI